MTASPLVQLTVAEMAVGVREGIFSSQELVEAHLAAIERANGALNALVHIAAEEALADARRADEERSTCRRLGALHGVPFTVKTHIDVSGMPTTEASLLVPPRAPARDAAPVARLRRAGAIPLGKTNMSEFAMFPDSANRVFGVTRNPCASDRSPGGSSGGEACAVAACLSPFGIGSDYGGSIRCPAHFCGVAGLRPGLGVVPRRGAWRPTTAVRGALTTVGPLARSAEDLELIFGVIGRPRRADLPSRAAVFVDALARPVEAPCRDAVAGGAAALAALGVDVVESVPARQEQAERVFARATANETWATLARYFPARLADASPQLVAQWEPERKLVDWPERALSELTQLAAEAEPWLDEHPLLLAPAVAVPAFPLGTLDGVFELFGHCTYASALGLPAATVRAGTTPEGLPVAVQVIARRGHEAEALTAAGAIERALGPYPSLSPASTTSASETTDATISAAGATLRTRPAEGPA